MKNILVILTILSSLSAFAESDCQKRLSELSNRSYSLGQLNGALDMTNNFLSMNVIVPGYVNSVEKNRQSFRETRYELFEKNIEADLSTEEKFIKECLK